MTAKTNTHQHLGKSVEELKAKRRAAHQKKMEKRAEGQKKHLHPNLILIPIPGIESNHLAGSDGHVYTRKT